MSKANNTLISKLKWQEALRKGNNAEQDTFSNEKF